MATDQERIEELERQVHRHSELINALYRQLGIGQLDAADIPTGGANPAIVDAIKSGSIIQAIKLYREDTGVGLKQAKDAVETIARSLGR